MQHPAAPARITQRDTVYKAVDPDTGLGLRLKPQRPHLDTLALCTWFRTGADAELAIARAIGASNLEIVRCDR